MKLLYFVALLLLPILSFFSNSAEASCVAPTGTPIDWARNSDLAFVGKVIAIHEPTDFWGSKIYSIESIKIYTFAVETMWNGPAQRTIEVYAPLREAVSIGVNFELNQKYLIFAYKDEQNNYGTNYYRNFYGTNACQTNMDYATYSAEWKTQFEQQLQPIPIPPEPIPPQYTPPIPPQYTPTDLYHFIQRIVTSFFNFFFPPAPCNGNTPCWT